MDKHTLGVLEFDSLKKTILSFSNSTLGKNKIESIQPVSNEKQVARLQRLTKELILILNETTYIPGEGTEDITDIIAKSRMEGTILDTEGFMSIWRFLSSARKIREFISNSQLDIPELKKLAESITVSHKIEKAISFVFTDDGNIKDNASAKLKSIRGELKSARQSILRKLQNIIDKKRGAECLYNDQISMREGRYVLFVRAEKRGSVEGVIHDKSMSGATCFIEPAEVIEQGNKLRALTFDERNEILRIKKFLTNMVREELDVISSSIEPLSEFEYLLAGAKFGREFNMVSPEISDDKSIKIVDGYHPLLLARIGRKAIPLSIELTSSTQAVIITGPNMGGKTVALKATGLLCLMFQSGFPIPAGEGTRFPVLKGIYADIGDEQSLQNDTSTFSSHITRLNEILNKTSEDSLILLDEFGTGTDPAEGSSLAIAMIEEMIARKMFVIANTHLFQLKLFAANTPLVKNASMLFDMENSAPTYRFAIDIPGSSNAIETAKNLGLLPHIIKRACELLGDSPAELEELIKNLHQERIQLISEKQKYSEEKQNYQILARRYKEKLLKFEEEKTKALSKKLSEMEESIKSIKKEFEQKVTTISADGEQLKSARRQLESYHKNIKKEVAIINSELSGYDEEDASQPNENKTGGKPIYKNQEWKIGDSVIVPPFMAKGKITGINQKNAKATVSTDNTQIEVSLKNLIAPPEAAAKQKAKPVITFSAPSEKGSRFNPSLNLRGYYVEDAIPKLEKHISDAIIMGFKSFSVIHGLGTGKLKHAVKEFLKGHPQVKSFRDGKESEGGLGATIVELT